MPYPLSELPYGMSCRLGELAKLVERYNLQIAAGDAGDDCICPPALQLNSFRDLTLNSEEMKILDEETDRFLFLDVYNGESKVDLIKTFYTKPKIHNHIFMIRYTNVEGLKLDIFNHFILRPIGVSISWCDVTKPFLETLSFLTDNSINYMCISTGITMINFTYLLTTFPRLKGIQIHCAIPKNWPAEIMAVKNHQLSCLNMSLNEKEFEYLEAEIIIPFLMAQKPGFELGLWLPPNPDGQNIYLKLKESYSKQKQLIRTTDFSKKPTRVRFRYSGDDNAGWVLTSSD